MHKFDTAGDLNLMTMTFFFDLSRCSDILLMLDEYRANTYCPS